MIQRHVIAASSHRRRTGMAMRAYIHNKKLEFVVLVQRRAVDSYSRA